MDWNKWMVNEEVLDRISGKRTLLRAIRERKRIYVGHWLRRESLIVDALEKIVSG